MFLLLGLLGGLFNPQIPVHDYKTLPAEVIALPFNAARLAPWAPDQTSRMTGFGDTSQIAAPKLSDFSSMVQLAASSGPTNEDLQTENEELRKRIEQLEQLMKNTLSQPPVSSPNSAETHTDKKSVPGWIVELHPWNKASTLSADPNRKLLTQNCNFKGNFELEQSHQMHVYRFLGIFRAKAPGRYVFSNDLKCGFNHECNFHFKVDDQPLMDVSHYKTKGQRLTNGLPLTAGDHRLEFTIGIDHNRFINYRPKDHFGWHVLVKGPNDFDQREFKQDELFSVIPKNTNLGAKACVL